MRHLQGYQVRVIEELVELDRKRLALQAFIRYAPTYWELPQPERARLLKQYAAMTQYSSILKERIENFEEASDGEMVSSTGAGEEGSSRQARG